MKNNEIISKTKRIRKYRITVVFRYKAAQRVAFFQIKWLCSGQASIRPLELKTMLRLQFFFSRTGATPQVVERY